MGKCSTISLFQTPVLELFRLSIVLNFVRQIQFSGRPKWRFYDKYILISLCIVVGLLTESPNNQSILWWKQSHRKTFTLLADKAKMSRWLRSSHLMIAICFLLQRSGHFPFLCVKVNVQWATSRYQEVYDDVIRCCPRRFHLCRNARADRELLDALPLFFGRGFISQIQAGVCPKPAAARYSPQLLIYWPSPPSSLPYRSQLTAWLWPKPKFLPQP